jgi:hypothetical protein
MAAIRQNSNPRPTFKGNQTTRCEFCKKEGRSKDECWCLHPNLRQGVASKNKGLGELIRGSGET